MIYVNGQQEFHLTNNQLSYIFRVTEKTGILEQLYFGEAIPHMDSFYYLVEREIRPSNNYVEGDHTSSFEHIKQEMPLYGTTDFRYPAVEITYPDGDRIGHFCYESHQISHHKLPLPHMPSTSAEEGEADRLTIILKDVYSSLTIEMNYTIFLDHPVITRQSRIHHHDDCVYTLDRLMSMSLDLPNDAFDWIHLDGAWARETQFNRETLHSGIQMISSTRGASSHVHNPFLALCAKNSDENQGSVYGFSLIYSGNFIGQIEVDTYNIARVQLGINPFQFSWELKADEPFDSPEAVMVYTSHGLNGMSQAFHGFYREHLIRKEWVNRPRPIVINNWEATYFDFDEEKILTIAKEAKDLGIECFVLDDGWFGRRDNDASSLGDWREDRRKLPKGITHLSQQIEAIGLSFGLWFEPEMVSKGTQLYEQHPDWVVGHPKKNISHGRNQYVLDFSRQEVVDHIFDQIDAILSESQITYMKWDMNRYISEAYSQTLGTKRQGEFFHRYILGVYSLYEKLLTTYPELLIESCAGGGGRFDPGLLYYAPQTWISDDTDAVERLKIQYGASMVYPLSAMGSHVSAVPNHQVARNTSLAMRGNVALFGTFGYELDVTQLSEEDRKIIKEQVNFFKEHRRLLHSGIFYRLVSPFEKNECGLMVVSQDRKEALVGYYQVLAKPNTSYQRLPLKGLTENVFYQLSLKNQKRSGKDLMTIGLLLGDNYIDRATEYWQREMPGDFSSQIFYLQQVEE
mgnify:CR=1 FL=1